MKPWERNNGARVQMTSDALQQATSSELTSRRESLDRRPSIDALVVRSNPSPSPLAPPFQYSGTSYGTSTSFGALPFYSQNDTISPGPSTATSFEHRANTPPRTSSSWRYATASERRSPSPARRASVSPPRRYSPPPVRRRSPSPYRGQFARGRSPVREPYTPPRQIFGRSRSSGRAYSFVGASQSVYDWESGVGGFTGGSNRRSESQGPERRWTDPGV